MGILRQLLAHICAFVYNVIAYVYELFINISRVKILSSKGIEPIYQRITLILAIIMVFYITFEFVKFVVQPDGLVDKEKGAQKTVFKMIIVVVLIAFVPNIFTWAYELQNAVFDNQLFSKIILGKQDVEMSKIGRDFSANMLSMFYYVDESIEWKNENKAKKCGDLECKQVVSLNLDYMRNYGKLPYITMGLDEEAKAIEPETGEKVDEYKIYFNGWFALIVGCFMVYMLVLYCIDAGVRVVQLTFLQIIAPIPIIGYLSPKKDGIFQKWVKQCTTTYLDLFIRVGIIYFILLIAQIISEAYANGTLISNVANKSADMKIFIYIAIIMGLLLFAKKAPDMLKELFPNTGAASGNFGLKAGSRVAPAAARAIGAGLGGANRLVKGGIARARNNAKRNQAIKEKRRAEGKDTSKKAIRQERKQARLDEKHAKKQNRQATRDFNKENRDLKKENNAVLDAEAALRKAKRSGNQSEIEKATKNLAQAEAAREQKKAERRAELDLERARKGGNAAEIAAAQKNLDNIHNRAQNEREVNRTAQNLTNAEERSKEFEKRDEAVTAAQKELDAAKASGDATAIAEAQKKLDNATSERNALNGLDVDSVNNQIGVQQQILDSKQQELTNNENAVTSAQQQYDSATQAVTSAQTQLTEATNSGDAEIAAAQAALDAAKASGNDQQIAMAEQALNQAMVNKNIAVSKAQANLTSAEQTAVTAKDALTTATNTRDSNKSRLETDVANAKSAIKVAEQTRDRERNVAQAAVDLARTKQEEAATKLATSTSAIQETAQQTRKDLNQANQEYAQKQSEYAEAQNQRLRNRFAGGVVGAAQGAWRGASEGIKATKLEDIRKQIKAGEKLDREKIAANEKWIDSGGTTLGSKIKASVQKDLGILTDAQVSDIQTRNYDTQISTNKRLSAIEGAAQQNLDGSKSRSDSKIESGEQKTVLKENLTYAGADGEKLTIRADGKSTTSQIYQQYKNDAQATREKAQAARQAAAQAKAEGKPNAEELEKEADNLAKEATRQESALGQVKKKLTEYAITEVLRTPASQRRDKNILGDQVLVEKVENTLQSVEESKRNNDTYNRVVAEISRIAKPEDREVILNAYRTGNFSSFDELDIVQTALVNVKGQRERDTSTLETMQGIWKASSKLDAEKAADGSSGK